MQRVQRFAEIDAPVEVVFDRFSDFENFSRWMRNVKSVRRVGRRQTHWVCETAMPELYAEWDAEVTVFEPDRRIVWRSMRGDIDADGEAIFTVTPYGTTLVRVVLGYDTPLGRSGEQAARFFGVHPGEQLAEDLEHFRRIVEREFGGRWREHAERAGSFRPVGAARREAGRFAGAVRRPAQPLVKDEGARHRARRTDELSRGRETEVERGRAARPVGDGRESSDERRPREKRIARAREEEEYRPRYALTPRERERERGREQRSFDPRVSEIFTRRGVDHLVDDPPSRRWRGEERERE